MNDTITNCPAHLAAALDEARARWIGTDIEDCRAHQAAEVLEHAAGLFRSRSWSEDDNLGHAWLGAWLAEQADAEDGARRAAEAAASKAADLGTLTADEIALILAARSRR